MSLSHAFAVILFIKIIVAGVSFSDCLGLLIVLSAIQLERITSYIYPKRPDLFHEISLVQHDLTELQKKADSTESDVTALKFTTRHK